MTVPHLTDLTLTPLYGSYGHHPSSTSISLPPMSTFIEYGGIRLLIDVGLDESSYSSSYSSSSPSSSSSPPSPSPSPSSPSSSLNLPFDLPKVDAILVCNSSLSSIGGLPYFFSKRRDSSVQRNQSIPPIYGTFPTVKMGQMTLYDTHSNHAFDGVDLQWDLDDVDNLFSPSHFFTLKYSQSTILKYRDKPALMITPHRSGHVVGGAFWVLKNMIDETEVVIAPSFHHSKEKHLDPYTLLKFGSAADVLITRPGGPCGILSKLYRPDPSRPQKKSPLSPPLVARAEGDLIELVMSALRRGGNVLLPVDASGRVLELLLLLSRHWEKHRLGTAYNLCWVGPMTHNTIDYARSQLEWMAEPLGEQFDSQRGHPLSFNSVHILSGIGELETLEDIPMVVLASGSNLDCGPSRDLLLKWADNPDHAIVLTDYQRCGVPRRAVEEEMEGEVEIDNHKGEINNHRPSKLSTAAQLLHHWCVAKANYKEMPDSVTVDVLVPHRAPLAGKELDLFLREEERVMRAKRLEEEKRAMLREVELARGRLRLGDEDAHEETDINMNMTVEKKERDSAHAQAPPRKKSRFDSSLFLKFSKPLYMTFEVREEAVGIGQSDSIAKYGVGESVGQSGEVLEDDYGIAVVPERFVDIVTGIDPSRYGNTGRIGEDVLRRGLGFGADGKPVLGGARGGGADNINSLGANNNANPNESTSLEDEQAQEAQDLSEGKGIIRGRNGRPHIKVSTLSHRIEVLAEVAYVPLEGRVDARAARQSVRALQPRQVVILGGGRPTDEEQNFIDSLKKADGYDSDDDEEALWGEKNDLKESDKIIGEATLLSDAVRELTLGGNKDQRSGSVFTPASQQMVKLSVGHAAYSARLVDIPYTNRREPTAAQSEDEDPPLPVEPFEAKMGDCTVSLVDCVATGQKVAADGSIVLAPRDAKGEELRHPPTVMLSDGDVLLTDLRSEVIAQGMKAEYSAHSGYQQLVVNNKIVVKKESSGKIQLEGPLCEDFFVVRSVVCSQYVTM